jgi:hypothetical protein
LTAVTEEDNFRLATIPPESLYLLQRTVQATIARTHGAYLRRDPDQTVAGGACTQLEQEKAGVRPWELL